MASRLSDEELRKVLSEFGEDVGPITPTTRSAWERRLISHRKSKVFSPRKMSANALSSDDSEIDNNLSPNTRRSKRTSLHRQNSEAERSSASRPEKSSTSLFDTDDIFKKPASLNSSFSTLGKKMLQTNHLKTKNSVDKVRKSTETFDIETSDSDFELDNSFTSRNSHRTRRKPNRPSKTQNMPSISFSSNKNSSWNSNSEIKLNHFSSSSDSFMIDNRKQAYHENGYISNSLSNGGLSEEKVEQGTSTNYSHCISWLLLFGTAAFFIIIGVVYISELQKTSHMSTKSISKFCDRVNKENCENLIVLSRELHHLLSSVAGAYDCVADREMLNRSVTIPDARLAMQSFFSRDDRFKEEDNFDFLFYESVILLTKNSEMGVIFYPVIEDKSSQNVKDLSSTPELGFSALEAAQGSKSLGCRIRLSLKWTVTKIVLLCCVGFIAFLCLVLMKFWKKRREGQEKVFFEMVERVIDILQETSDWSADHEPCKPVVRVRDAIIPPKERKEKLWLWDRVVAFIEENESRVSVEYHTINGEDYKVWKWQPTTEQGEGGKSGKVWQGQAFSSLGKGKNTMYSLSPCLKIRNMFDSEMASICREYEDGWEVSIKDAILEKCEGNDGIRHIAIDTSNNEGCVYMLCSSTETAGKAFNDLHGWWFDGKLVTVKYIPYKRYLERFPQSEHCTEPLRPSNNKRLSLSTPFFSSALERS